MINLNSYLLQKTVDYDFTFPTGNSRLNLVWPTGQFYNTKGKFSPYNFIVNQSLEERTCKKFLIK